MQKVTKNFVNQFRKRFKAILNSDLTSNQIASNFTIGILIGLLVPMGLQTIVVVIICALFSYNFVIIVFATLISNPFTVIFIYYSAFKIGEIFINSGISWIQVSKVLNNPELESILNLSFNSLKVIYTGLLIESVVLSILTYIFVYYIAIYVKSKRNIISSIISNK